MRTATGRGTASMRADAGIGLLAGLIFGAGLALSGMADPSRVRGFLDIAGAWDPTLAFVMGGALVPMVIAWRLRARLDRPWGAPAFDLPTRRRPDRALLTGAVLFGLGWGVAGLCPGPAIADLSLAPLPAAIFVLAMLAGMGLHRIAVDRPLYGPAGSPAR